MDPDTKEMLKLLVSGPSCPPCQAGGVRGSRVVGGGSPGPADGSVPARLPAGEGVALLPSSSPALFQDFGSLSNLQVTQPTVGMNFKTPRGAL